MSKSSRLLCSVAILAVAGPAYGQVAGGAGAASTATEQGGMVAADAVTDRDMAGSAGNSGDIIVTATRRSQALSDVPLAVSAVSGEALALTGATDIRALNQLSPSLLVSSTSSEAGGAVARIRGIGTVGDNPGLESSVALFVDGVYRSRTSVGLTELGAIDRIEVLRGPQGTLFGRNASAGLISVITAKPSFQEEGTAEATFGNYGFRRYQLGFTGPINSKIAYRLDGVRLTRDGFARVIEDGAGTRGRDVNDRDRWVVRGQLLFQPTDATSVRLIGDYSKRDEECCAGVYLLTRDVRRGADGSLVSSPSSTAAVVRSLGGYINDRPFDREVSVTPGRTYRQDVEDWGVSGEVNHDFGGAALTSITAYRYNDYQRGQDADFNSLDLLYRPDDGRDFIRFRTFSQELRLQGEAFAGKLDWLVGGYFADERLDVRSSLTFGADYDRYITQLVRAQGGAAAGFGGFTDLRGFAGRALASQGAVAPAAVLALVPNLQPFDNTGQNDRYRQRSRNFAIFTHNVVHLTDTLSLTLGARYTNENKRLAADFRSTVPGGNAATSVRQAVRDLQGLAGTSADPVVRATAAAAATALNPLAGPAGFYGVLTGFNGVLPSRKRSDDEWTGTAVLSWKPVRELLTYASFSRGYKAGGFNLDRSVLGQGALLGQPAPDLTQLEFEEEKVDAYELGAKYNGRGFGVNVALFQQKFRNFQLNNFQGVNFIVANIRGCTELAGGPDADRDQSAVTGACIGQSRPGVRSRGVELEAYAQPITDVNVTVGFTLADTKYRDNLSSAPNALNPGGALPTSLLNLPGQRVSNSSLYTVTGGAGWTPAIGSGGLRGLVYVDARYQSDLNTGSDLFPEKKQNGFLVVNARVGVTGADGLWALEFWAQNLLDEDYTQIAFNAPLQGGGDTLSVLRGQQASSNRLYGAFLAEPRTYGLTLRTRF